MRDPYATRQGRVRMGDVLSVILGIVGAVIATRLFGGSDYPSATAAMWFKIVGIGSSWALVALLAWTAVDPIIQHKRVQRARQARSAH